VIDIGPCSKILSFPASISFRKAADNYRFLKRIYFENPLEGINTLFDIRLS